MKKSKTKRFDRDFESFKDQTLCYIHIESHEEVPVFIERKENTFLLSFKFQNRSYKSDMIIVDNSSDYVRNDLSRIRFPEIILNEIDLNNIALCIDSMVNELLR
jgi:hypothetical protein